MGFNSFIEVFAPPPSDPEACDAYATERRARYGPPWYKVKDRSTFKQCTEVTLTATCKPAECPTMGLGAWSTRQGNASLEAFVLSVGKDVPNGGVPMLSPQPIL